MIFFFKPKTINLDCFTYAPEIFEYSPIVKGNECFPEWWKKLPKTDFDFEQMVNPINMRRCAGFMDYHSNSACLRLWTDLAIKLIGYKDENGEYMHEHRFSDNFSELVRHRKEQYGQFLSDEFRHFKITSPWFFSCKEDINWVFVQNSWNRDLNQGMNILPGTLNFKYQGGTHLQTVFEFQPGKVLNKFFAHNTPMVNIFPMSEKKLKIHNHLVTGNEYVRMNAKHNNITFSQKYFRTKEISKQNEKKCPFHFGA